MTTNAAVYWKKEAERLAKINASLLAACRDCLPWLIGDQMTIEKNALRERIESLIAEEPHHGDGSS